MNRCDDHEIERLIALGLVVGWVALVATARWSWRFVIGR